MSASRTLLLTGASGKLGQIVAPLLAKTGWHLRLTDLNPYPGELPANSAFQAADLNDYDSINALAEGTRAIVHLGALVDYGTFETVVGPNMRGMHTVFEAARRNGVRVVNASSNHVIGFYERTTKLDIAAPMRPDSYYGLSKAYGELVARFYFDRYGVESVSIRIGSCFDEPKNERMLATWLSRPDLARLISKAVEADRTGCAIVWGVSNNNASWWYGDDRDLIGWEPQDSADGWAGRFDPPGDRIADRCQGGGFCEMPDEAGPAL